MKRVLLLGAGLVARPLARYLFEQPDIRLTVTDCELERAEALLNGDPRGRAALLNIDNVDGQEEALSRLFFPIDTQQGMLSKLISEHDLTISLLPYTYHVAIAKLCIRHHKNMVTASYVSPEMRALDSAARESGILILNEIGVDPGLDHMSAMRVIDDVKTRGGQVTAFSSYCGGLPAPDANTNPWGYKFSWSPRGVVMAGKNPGRFLRDGKIIDIPGQELFSHCETVTIPGAGEFEGYTNRDCLEYIETYGLAGVKSMFRGTLRYPGWCVTLKALVDLGYLDDTERGDLVGKSYADLMRMLLTNDASGDLRAAVAKRLGLAPDAEPLTRMAWLGLFSDETLPQATTVMDVLVERMNQRMPYQNGERDMVVLHHEFDASFPGGTEKITSTLVDYGIPGGDSAMARTVSLPVAVAVKLILEGKIARTGVKIPVTADLYGPILDELETLGIVCKEKTL